MTDLDKKYSKFELWKNIAAIAIAFLVSAAYRLGGSQFGKRWFRPVGVGIGVMAILWILFGFHWSIFLSAGASAGVSTTYFKKKGEDAKWWNWLIAGFCLSLSLLPWAILTKHLAGFGVRTVFLTPMFMIWSDLISNAIVEELGRGFLIIGTLLLLRIGS